MCGFRHIFLSMLKVVCFPNMLCASLQMCAAPARNSVWVCVCL